MPTPAERQALLFFAAVAALGVGVNAWRAARGGDAVIAGSPSELAAQIARIDSAAASSPSFDAKRKKKGAGAPGSGRRPPASAGNSAPRQPTPAVAPGPPPPVAPVDLDVATMAAIESLPRIGPALASRIIASRDSFGAFGSIDGLQRVRGIGPAMAKALRPLVTFSGVPSPGAPTGATKGHRRPKVP